MHQALLQGYVAVAVGGRGTVVSIQEVLKKKKKKSMFPVESCLYLIPPPSVNQVLLKKLLKENPSGSLGPWKVGLKPLP